MITCCLLPTMINHFKWCRFDALIILHCGRWFSKYAVSVCLEHTNSDGGVELCER